MTAKKQIGRKEVSRMPRRGKGFVGAALLTAGLAFGGCHVKTAVEKPTTPKMEQKSPARQGTAKKADCSVKQLGGGTNQILMMQGKCKVRTGDELLKAEFLLEKAGWLTYSVGKVDERGVEILMEVEVFMSEYASNRQMPWRVNFGESKKIGKVFAPDGRYVGGEDMFTVEAERGPEPGTAILTIK